jgi:serine/threonine protein kinase
VRPEPATDALVGKIIAGRYQLLRRIGKGGMGLVYEADHLGIGKRVAVKLLLDKYTDDEEVVARFQREARTASAIGDDHIVEVFDAGVTEDGRSYLVMELLLGHSLAEIAEATGPMPAVRAVPIVRQVLRGLDAAHAKGIVHRDMKPENVFVVQKPDRPDYAKIMDFGISKFMQLSESKVRLTATGAVIGTPVYMAPEQALGVGEIDARVDLYAVGVMLYELLAGRPPFQAPTYIALVTQHLHTPPPPLALARPDLPPRLIAAVHRALEKEPKDRFTSAAEMAAALPADSELANFDRIATLTGPTRVGPGSRVLGPDMTAASSPRGRAARAAATPGGAAMPSTTHGPALSPVNTARLKRWSWMAAVVAVAAALGAAIVVIALRPTPRPAPTASMASEQPAIVVAATASLEVVSDPSGAAVTVDGTNRGVTPVVIGGLAAGVFEVRLTKPGYAPVSIRKSVRLGRDESISAVMAKAAGSATVDDHPAVRGKQSPATNNGSGSGRLLPLPNEPVTPTTPEVRPKVNHPAEPSLPPTPPLDRKKNPFGA